MLTMQERRMPQKIHTRTLHLRFSSFSLHGAGDSATALRLLILAEIISGCDFQRDRLYVEYRILIDQDVWKITHPRHLRDCASGFVQVVRIGWRYVCHLSQGIWTQWWNWKQNRYLHDSTFFNLTLIHLNAPFGLTAFIAMSEPVSSLHYLVSLKTWARTCSRPCNVRSCH